jgi:hypothetical protein
VLPFVWDELLELVERGGCDIREADAHAEGQVRALQVSRYVCKDNVAFEFEAPVVELEAER